MGLLVCNRFQSRVVLGNTLTLTLNSNPNTNVVLVLLDNPTLTPNIDPNPLILALNPTLTALTITLNSNL